MLGVGSNPDSRDAAWNWPGDHEAASWRLLLASVGVPVSDSPSPQASRWSLELRSMTGRSPGSQSVSQTVLFLAAFPLPGRAFVGNRARRCAPRIDPRSQPLTRNPGKSNAAGNRAHPCLQGPRAIQDTAHRTATCHRRQESAGLLFFSWNWRPSQHLLVSSQRNDKRPVKLHGSIKETGEQGQRHLRQRTAPYLCERTPSYVCQGDLFPFRKLQRKKMMQISQRGRMSSAMSNSARIVREPSRALRP